MYGRANSIGAASASLLLSLAASAAGYERAGWVAELSTIAHGVQGTVTIVDHNTLLVENFHYDGAAPAVYFYLGADDSHGSFVTGLELLPQLVDAYEDATLTLNLEFGQSLDGYDAISVWCAAANANFGSGTFVAPVACPGDVDGDGRVGFGDLLDVLANWGCSACPADVDGDGTAGFGDVTTVLAAWGDCVD